MNDSTIPIRADIAAMTPYVPVPDPGDTARRLGIAPERIVKLDANENPRACPDLSGTLGGCRPSAYPDPEYRELRNAIGRYVGVDPSGVVVGNGEDELIDLMLRLICNPGDGIILTPPTFGVYESAVRLNRARPVTVPRRADYSVDTEAVIARCTRDVTAVIICDPNNPTGTPFPQNELEQLLATGKTVIVDEAYAEFARQTAVGLTSRYPNLIVLRTMSKWAGLAGLRLGYAVMQPATAAQLMKIKPPYNVNAAAVAAGLAVLTGRRTASARTAEVIRERARLEDGLSRIAWCRIVPSSGNFVFASLAVDTAGLRAYLESRGILLRYFSCPPTGNAVRITVGTPRQNDRVLESMAAFRPVGLICDGILFDMDGVLVDVRSSYRTAIRQTAETFLADRYGLRVTVTDGDISSVKGIPGFNNDWDTAYAVVRRFGCGEQPSALSPGQKRSGEYGAVKDLFQALYLGTERYGSTYGRIPPIAAERGLMDNETPLIDMRVLSSLASRYPIGIATSRPRSEALACLTRLGITPGIIPETAVVALEDAPREKPFPDPLRVAAGRVSVTRPVYVGDSINDIMAADAAGMPSVAVGGLRAGTVQVASVNDIEGVLI